MSNTLPLIGYSHRLSPVYIFNRVMRWLYHSQNQSGPWMNKGAADRLESLVSGESVVWEWGSGRSTVWLARRCSILYSIEDSREWYENVREGIERDNLNNAFLMHFAADEGYADSILNKLEDGAADVIIVDGKVRGGCALNAISKLKPGGVLLVDDAQRYLLGCPHRCQGRISLPDSMTPEWTSFAERVEGWKREWFSDGVSASLFLYRPAKA